MDTSLEMRLGAMLCELLRQGMRLDTSCCRTLTQVLNTEDILELEIRLERCEDAEVESMRALALFPDQGQAMAVEMWLANEEGDKFAGPPDMDALAQVLEGSEVRLSLSGMGEIQLRLRQDDARQFLKRLYLGNSIPEGIVALLRDHSAILPKETIFGARVVCKRACLDWSPNRERFILDLLRSSCRAAPGEPLRERLLPLLEWCLGFLGHAGEDIFQALSRRRDSLRRCMDQAEDVRRMREKHNYETRRMLGMVESTIDPTVLRRELAFVDMAARATGGYASPVPALERDFGTVPGMQGAMDVLDEQSLSHYTAPVPNSEKPET